MALRVVHVLAPAQFGGLERVVYGLAAGHRARGHHVTAVALSVVGSPESPVLAELRAADVDVRTVAVPGRAYRAQARAISELCAELGPDVVHSHGYLPDFLMAVLKKPGFPAIATTVHGFTGGGLKNRVYERLQVRSHRRFDAVIAVSTALQTRLLAGGVEPSRVHVLRNAWNAGAALDSVARARATLGVPEGVLSVGWVGRVSYEKGLDILVRALPELADLSLRVIVVGEGRDSARVAALAQSLGVSDRIMWRGVVPDAGRLFPAFDVLVLSSRTEGTPITLLEAMRANVPIVAAAVGGVPDVVSLADALLVRPDDPLAIARAVRSVLGDREAAAGRASSARARLESVFALDPWLDAHERIYREISPARN